MIANPGEVVFIPMENQQREPDTADAEDPRAAAGLQTKIYKIPR